MSALINAIRSGDLRLTLPAPLLLSDGQVLYCDQLLRLLPRKRGVFKARLGDQIVLAKIFLNNATRQISRELAGYERLMQANQPTPKYIATISFDGGAALLFEFLNNARSLFCESSTNDIELSYLLDRLQSMYRTGIYHDDLHWGNFLWNDGVVYVIDAGAVVGSPQSPLASEKIIDNLGILIAQFHRCDQENISAGITQHALFHQFHLSADALKKSAEMHWHRRKQALLKKCFRSTTSQYSTHVFDRTYAYRRTYAGSDLENFLRSPDNTMARGQAIKLGNSATVVKLIMDGRTVVIKRYNVKNIWHWLRRCWRPSRAWNSWRNAHWLELLGLNTPPPIALLEMRIGPLRGRAYYVCEFVKGEILSHAFDNRAPTTTEMVELENYFTITASDRLIHGDMKATNFLMQKEKLFILDLDAMHEEASSRWVKLYWQDFMRFKRNWTEDTTWLAQLNNLVNRLIA